MTATFTAPSERPEVALASWRANRPAWLPDHYKEINDSYESVTWEWRHKEGMMKVIPGAKFFAGEACYRITALFKSDGHFGSVITVNGDADRHTREALSQAAEKYVEGGIL
jgi:hypothetical protein